MFPPSIISRMTCMKGYSFIRTLRPRLVSRCFSSSGHNWSLYKLRSRGLMMVKGRDTVSFLQGLLTSDVECLGSVMGAQYSMMLNVQGRVLYDLLLYDFSKDAGEPVILVECDRNLTEQLINDIKKYKIRKKVTLDNISDSHSVFAAISESGSSIPDMSSVSVQLPDPRVPDFGQRIVSDKEFSREVLTDETGYHERRLQWGIPEGPQDLPPGNCFPLESNLVYMNGVSFSKGCYLGQELTARTHHTGVTRKRLMPLVFQSPPGHIEPGENIKSENNKNVGKFRSNFGKYGLGLMRTNEVNGDLTVLNDDQTAVTLKSVIPDWWPKS